MKLSLAAFHTLACLLASMPYAQAQYFDCEEELFPRLDKQSRLYGYVNFIGEQRVPPTFIRAYPFEGKYAIVQQGNKFGVLDCSGNLTVPAAYDAILSFVNGRGWVKQGNLWGLIDHKGKLLIPPTYEQVIEVNPRGVYAWVFKADKWGLISKENGRFTVPLEYDNYSNMSDSAGIIRKGAQFHIVYYGDGRLIYSSLKNVRKVTPELYLFQKTDGKYGVVTSLAYTLIRPEYDSVYLHKGLFYVRKADKWGIKNLKGQDLVPLQYDYIGLMTEGLAEAKRNNQYTWLTLGGLETEAPSFQYADNPQGGVSLVNKNGKWGVYTPMAKKFVIQPEYEKAYRNAAAQLVFLSAQGKGTLFTQQGQALTNFAIDSVCLADDKNLMRYRANSKWGILNGHTGQSLLSPTYDSIAAFSLEHALVKLAGKYGMIGKQGQVILPAEYERIQNYFIDNKRIFAVKKGNWALANTEGKPVTGFEYQLLAPRALSHIVAVKKNKYGVIDFSGLEILPLQYDFLSNVIETPEAPAEPLIFSKGKKHGLVQLSGKEIFVRQGIKITYLGSGIFAYEEGGKWGLVHQSGKLLAEPTWEHVGKYYEKLASAKQNGLIGFINQQGKWQVQPRYTEVLPPQGNLIFVKENGKWGAINPVGKTVVKPTFSNYSIQPDGKIKLIE